jgi:hypothetical protein
MADVVQPLLSDMLADVVLLGGLYLGSIVALYCVRWLGSALIGHKKF